MLNQGVRNKRPHITLFCLMKFLEKTEMEVYQWLAWGYRWELGLTKNEYKGTFLNDRNVLKQDGGDFCKTI